MNIQECLFITRSKSHKSEYHPHIMMLTLCDDVLKLIIGEVDKETIIALSHTCWQLYKLVRIVHRRVVLTNNIFEAVRIGSLVSFICAAIDDDTVSIAAKMRDITIDMLKYAHDIVEDDAITYRLCKLGVYSSDWYLIKKRSLIVHAIKYNKQELLAYMKTECGPSCFDQYCACGYAKIGDYDNFILHHTATRYEHDERLRYYAYVGGNMRIISIVGIDSYAYYEALLSHSRDMFDFSYSITSISIGCLIHIIKNDDYQIITHVHTEISELTIVELCIKYNAVNIIRKCGFQGGIYQLSHAPSSTVNVIDMTLEMAELLLQVTNYNEYTVSLIALSCNYRLTEMLRAKRLYKHEHTSATSHYIF